jgi:Ca2+-binding RTX toxin-like protein
LAPEVENLILISTTAIAATGNTLSNSLTGNTTGNTLDGNGGTDTLAGLTGNDYYIIDGLNDVVVEASGAGTDSVLANITNYTLVANVEVLQLGSGIVRGVGNASANTLVGSTNSNSLYGAAGNDLLDGGSGDDTLAGALVETSGGKGEIDTLTGGAGNDLFILGYSSGNLYNDGSTKAAGTSDYALITDFNTTGTDQIQLDGVIGNYTSATVAGGAGLYLVESGTGTVNELIAIFSGKTTTDVTAAISSAKFI